MDLTNPASHEMRRFVFFPIVGLALSSTNLAAQDNRPGVAVLSFENGGSQPLPPLEPIDYDALEVGIQQILMTELGQNADLRIVERARIKEIVDEIGREGVDPNTVVRMGRIVGAKYMVLGGFVDLPGTFRIDGRIVDTETSEIIQFTTVAGTRDELYQLILDLGTKITDEMDLPRLPSQVSEVRASRDLPVEALTMYSRALFYDDRNEPELAIQTLARLQRDFPQLTEATELLRTLERRQPV